MNPRENHFCKITNVGTEFDVTTVIVLRRCVGREVEKVVGRVAFVARMPVVKVFAHPDGHVASLRAWSFEDHFGVVLVNDDLVDVFGAVPVELDFGWRW